MPEPGAGQALVKAAGAGACHTGGQDARPPDRRRPRRQRSALPVDFSSPPYECSVASPHWSSLTELMDVITLAQQEKIGVLVEHFPLQRAHEAHQLLHNGRIQGRAVVSPHT